MTDLVFSQIQEVVFVGDITVSLLESDVPVSVSIKKSYETSMEFSWMCRTYTFNVPSWRGAGMSKFIKLFHARETRDSETYGAIEYSAGLSVDRISTQQKVASVLRGCRDIFTCLEKIFRTHQSSVMDYAMWYRENHRDESDYSSYITLRTCHCIVHGEIMAPMSPRVLVKF